MADWDTVPGTPRPDRGSRNTQPVRQSLKAREHGNDLGEASAPSDRSIPHKPRICALTLKMQRGVIEVDNRTTTCLPYSSCHVLRCIRKDRPDGSISSSRGCSGCLCADEGGRCRAVFTTRILCGGRRSTASIRDTTWLTRSTARKSSTSMNGARRSVIAIMTGGSGSKAGRSSTILTIRACTHGGR